MPINIDICDDLNKQIDNINVHENNFTINVSKIGSFFSLIELIKTKFPTKIVTIICLPYDGDNKKLLIANKHKFLFIIDNGIVSEVFVDDNKVDVSSYCFIIGNNPELPNDFILDLFCIYTHVMIYDWNEKMSEQDGYISGAEYGPPNGSYIRHPFYRDIVEITEGSSYCNYSGSTSYVNIITHNYICGGCSCFHSPLDLCETLRKNGYDCNENDFNLVRWTLQGNPLSQY